MLNIQLPRFAVSVRPMPFGITAGAKKYTTQRNGEEVSRMAHNHKVAGSIPASATKLVELNLFDSTSFVKRCC